MGSIGQAPVDFDDVMLEDRYDGMRANCQSKLAQVAFGIRFARKADPANLTMTSLHPASEMPTKMVGRRDGEPISLGVAATARLALDPTLEGVTGLFFDRQRPVAPHPWARNFAVQEHLWTVSEQFVDRFSG
ncbi:hypothetical protein [Curtobacterium sp. PhB128]|uniref:hypothetical protein n=1 Tax=Curtobacterium sp. PhB128 TaxID=2485177 RepID=UPI00104EB21D|nr:hypothetical protein [Curtobacterium sp. PhB128]TCL70124.1 hypothetical protein EDF23_1203 [Curtobacterium sp. PhB128]TCL89501.1 hypothetical protein EDF29_1213 [Curtobacterium sp. PhB138]